MIGKGGSMMINNVYYRHVYEYHQRWGPFPATAEDWCQAAQEAGQICKEHGNDKLLIDLMIAVYSDFEREYRAARERGELSG